jgi:hypothetical protein
MAVKEMGKYHFGCGKKDSAWNLAVERKTGIGIFDLSGMAPEFRTLYDQGCVGLGELLTNFLTGIGITPPRQVSLIG